ncbi:MAG: cache domain-containing protein [Candidatus Riflebacteria bacterium]|nr:cache domain-containing protein [Candidatus Riflebacteria bacterium]
MQLSALKTGAGPNGPAEESVESGPDLRVTVLSLSILLLIGILLIFTGYQAADTEKVFFREVALNANQEIATLVGRQFAQTFTNCTALLEDVAGFPSAVQRDAPVIDELFGVLLRRHDIYRVIYLLDEELKPVKLRYNIGSAKYRPIPDDKLALLKRHEVTRLLTDFYKSEEDPAISFACSVVDKQYNFRGIIGAELDLNFIQDIITNVRVGRTGEILLADRSGKIIFSSPGFTGIEEFRQFDVKRAFDKEKGSSEYGKTARRLVAYQRLRGMPLKALDPMQTITPMTAEIPDWLVVVQQNAQEAYMVADRMKYNLIILVVVGVIGLLLIARLWVDSL